MFGGSSIYSPLPQSNSESDEFSEEELHSFNERQGVITWLGKHGKEPGPEIIFNNKGPDVINHKQWDDDRDLGIILGGFQIGSEVPAFTTNKNRDKLSPARKLCFTFSIFLCIFATVFFLWILPCEIDLCPHASVFPMKKTLSHIEIFGPVSIGPAVAKDNMKNLIFLFRKSFTGERDGIMSGKAAGGSGAVSISAGNKDASWWIFLEKEPRDVDCNLIDVNLDGVNDCLVVGKNSLLVTIESLSGKKLWEFTGGQAFTLKRCNFAFPLILPDLNGDGVGELLSVCPDDGGTGGMVPHSQNYFMLISGRTGSGIGKPAEITDCYSIVDVALEKDHVISYKCSNQTNKDSDNRISLRDLLLNVNASNLGELNIDKTYSSVLQHKSDPDANVLYLDGRRFSVENKGQCPGQCSMFVTIDDERTGQSNNQTICGIGIHNSYGMIPVGLKREKFSVFVFKYWHWESDEQCEAGFSGKTNSKNRDKEEKEEEKKKKEADKDEDEGKKGSAISRRLGESKPLEYAMFGGDLPKTVRHKRTVAKKLPDGTGKVEGNILKGENMTFHRIVEKIIFISFNETDIHVINNSLNSQREIVQICRNRSNCQPDANIQRQSLHIADIDNDNSEELISYTSSFVNQLDQESSLEDGVWLLQSVVEVIKLEQELSKVYGDKY